MDPQNPSFVITGTGVPGPWAALVAYLPFWLSGRTDPIDIPGWGLGPLEASYVGVERRLLGSIKQSGAPVAIIGHSQGGFHAVRFGLDHPDLVHTVIAISTPFGGLDATVKGIRSRITSRTLRLPAGRVIAKLAGRVWDAAEEPVERWLYKKAPSLHSLAFLGQPVHDLRDAVEQSWGADVRLVLVGGEKDKFVDSEDGTAWDLSIPNPEMLFRYFLGEEDPGYPGIKHWRARHSGHLGEMFERQLHKLVMKFSRNHREGEVHPVPLTIVA